MTKSEQSKCDPSDEKEAFKATPHIPTNLGGCDTSASATSDPDWFDAQGDLIAGDLVLVIEDGSDDE
ncbi:MAG TPA: hypothetical protein VGK19_18105 [Capsulimonadaceae bacterium]|jgi:hypothetical protein